MNAETVVGLLGAIGVPPGIVSVGVEADNTWCLVLDADSETPGWEVFWREQGNRYDWARFTSEQVACHYLFGRLTWSQVVRGVVGVLPVTDRARPVQPQPVPEAPSSDEPETGQIPVIVLEDDAPQADTTPRPA